MALNQPAPSADADPDFLRRLAGEIAAAEHDEATFPASCFATLHGYGLLAGPGAGTPMLPTLRLLAAVGRGDLGTGRIFEGHLNALDLVDRFGSREQGEAASRDAADGHLFAVWNTDAPGRPLRIEPANGAEGIRLSGAKSFASGIDGVTRALVTAQPPNGGRVMLLLSLDPKSEAVDRSWWQPIGMRNSVSHVVDLDGRTAPGTSVIGRPGDYVRQPWFGAGAVRFAAVQVGGMHAVLDAARAHLVGAGRAEAPYQLHRLARMAAAVEGGYGWLERAAAAWDRGTAADTDPASADAVAAVAHANLTRCALEDHCMQVLDIAQRAIGCAGLIEPHPLQRRIRDLMVYLRQPNPDGALADAGAAIANGDLEPGAW